MQARFLPLAFVVLAAAAGEAQEAPARAWPHETSDLPVDPRLHFGHLANGLRWVWAASSVPASRSYLRLHVDAGSLVEEESERGMAHFLEHMAFNGSEHFPAGTLVEWFQRHGMDVGADLNAFTDFGDTVYHVNLPESDEESLDEGLLVLRDFAFGLTLSPEEIEKEKGVVDGEESDDDSPEYRLHERELRSLCGGTRLGERLPLGVREVRARFTAEAVRAFYRRWYRPENMTVILVGDVGALDPAPLFEKHFGSAPRPASSPPRVPAAGEVARLAHRACVFEPEIPDVTLRVERLVPHADAPDDAAHRRAAVPLTVARRMLDLRLQELSKAMDAPVLGARAFQIEERGVLDGEDLTVTCVPERWRSALAFAEQQLRRALEHGFQPAELEEVRAVALRALDTAVGREPTQESASLVDAVLQAAGRGVVPISAAARRELLEPVFRALTLEACQDALREAWSPGELSLTTAGALDLGPDAARRLEAAWSESRGTRVEEGLAIPLAEFAYPPAADAREVLAAAPTCPLEDFGCEMTLFPNGVQLILKKTGFEKGRIRFRVVLGEGRLSLAEGEQALAWMAEQVFVSGGLEAHSVDELRRVLAGKDVDFTFTVRPESFVFEGSTTPEDLVLQCAVFCAYLQHPGWREDGFARAKRRVPLMFEGFLHDPEGPVTTAFLPALHRGDPRFSFSTREELEAVELPALRAWLDPILADAPLQVTLVGDLDRLEGRAAVARTFAALPQRREARPYEERRAAPAPRSGVHQVHLIDTKVPKALVMLVFPVPDGMDSACASRFDFLTDALNDRLRIEVRERLGAAYDPSAVLDQSCLYPGVGTLTVRATTEPAAAEVLMEACLAVTDALARDGVTYEEVRRMRAPLLEHLRDAETDNEAWLEWLSSRPCGPPESDGSAAEDDDESFYRALGPEPLTELARTYLARERASTLIVRPRDGAGPGVAGRSAGARR